ncbi:MAG: DNA-protecting protein DprA [Candidatus Gottesmanbacteria bacterium]|nr:DNA-protecting protein DprA [Candidatus Gottesmanbacteria bacterium]
MLPHRRVENWKKLPELAKLTDLSNPPKELYFAGTWDPGIFSSCVAIVGSRRMTDYGRRVIEKIIPRFVFEKKTIVSGFMYGVDQYAHEVCIENGGRTIAVLGWGITRALEGTDRKIAERIVSSGGLLLSEWKDQKPTLWTFPVRNRIVAALSEDIIVVEAAVKSGSLITANIARKLKRRLWAVPGAITSRLSGGTNMLIGQGYAKMWSGDPPQIHITKSDDPLLAILEGDGLTANDIARKLGKPVSEIGAQLSLLSVTGQLTEQGGKYYLNYVDQN